jgi:hypothetical protein
LALPNKLKINELDKTHARTHAHTQVVVLAVYEKLCDRVYGVDEIWGLRLELCQAALYGV